MTFLESSLNPKKSIWYYLLVLFLAFMAGNTIGAIPLSIVLLSKIFEHGIENFSSVNLFSKSSLEMMDISTNLFLVLMIIPFIFCLITLILLIKAFNKKNLKEIINGTNRIRWNRIAWGAGAWLVLLAVYLFIDYLIYPFNYKLQFDFSTFIPLSFISLLLLPLQTSFEELSFRGYLAQGIAGSTGSRWLALIIPSIIFGLLHGLNPEVEEYGFWIMMPNYIFIGLIFGLTSILDDGIEIAIGLHAANNIFLSVFVTSHSSTLQTAAVFEQLSVNPVKELIILFMSGFLVLSFFYKKYNWDLRVLNKKVKSDNNSQINF